MLFQKQTVKQEAIIEAEKLNLTGNHFYFTLLGELYTDIDNNKGKTFSKSNVFCKNTNRQTNHSKENRQPLTFSCVSVITLCVLFPTKPQNYGTFQFLSARGFLIYR